MGPTTDRGLIKYNAPFYVPNDTLPQNCGYGVAPGAQLPTTVPEPYNGIIAKAAAQFGTDPALMAAVFYVENGGTFPPADKKWPTSPAGAQGPWQFMPGTWTGVKDANPTGTGNVQDLTDATYGAAKYLSQLGGKNGIPFGDLNDPKQKPSIINTLASYNAGPAGNFQNKETQNYIKVAGNFYLSITGGAAAGGTTPTSAAGATTDACSGTASGGATGGTADGNAIVAIAQQELAKKPIEYDATVLKYTDGRREAWCADFVSWVYLTAGAPLDPSTAANHRIPRAFDLKSYFQAHGTWIDNGPTSGAPQPGDVVVYSYSHAGIVETVNGNTITVISGNTVNGTGSRNGETVGRRTINNYRGYGELMGWGRK